MEYTNADPFLSGATSTGASSAKRNPVGLKSYQASGRTSAGTGAATILIQGSNDNAAWVTLGTITLALTASGGTNDASDAFSSDDRFMYVRANVTALSGTGAQVSAALSA